MSCFVYVIGTSDGKGARTCVGRTNDLEKPVEKRNAGSGAKSMRGRHGRLIYAERLRTRRKAMRRERH